MSKAVAQHETYTIYDVYGETTPEIRGEVADLWLSNNALPDRESAEERAQEAACIIRDREEVIVGLSTVCLYKLSTDGKIYYYYRMFIRPDDRRPSMMTKVLEATCDLLPDFPNPYDTEGVLVVTHNPKLMRPGARKKFLDIGFEAIGTDRQGRDVWRKTFTENP